jgi:5-methylthioadenosine/S-adenosylhomocysteine deaminase
MATVEAARVARLEAGELQPGRLADLAILDLQSVHLQPFHEQDPINMLVFCARAGDVRDTFINGKVVMRNRRLPLVNEMDLLQEATSLKAEFTGT